MSSGDRPILSHIKKIAVISAAGLSFLIGASATPAQASPGSTSTAHAAAAGISLTDIATGLCLESIGSGIGGVYTTVCNGSIFQSWSSWNDGHNNYHLMNVATRQCLDSNFEGNVYALGCNEDGFQNWSFWSSGQNDYHFLNNKTQRCLDSDNRGRVYTLGCNEGNNQKWRSSNG